MNLGPQGEANTPENVSAVINKLGVELPQKSPARESISELFQVVDKIEVAPEDSFTERLFGDKASKTISNRAMNAALKVSAEAVSAIPDNVLAAAVNDRRGTSGAVSERDLKIERENREGVIRNRMFADLSLAGHALKAEKMSVLKAQTRQLEVKQEQSTAIANIAQATGNTTEVVERQVQRGVQELQARNPEMSADQARNAVIKLYRQKNIK